ncbi:hypothetical protein [Paenibacillus sp. IITD108]|uniref:hypothetical protein n=1 Tax=Paenibacillus sp. IITD108 TaxID=3116649 RepID=UPI002F42F77E
MMHRSTFLKRRESQIAEYVNGHLTVTSFQSNYSAKRYLKKKSDYTRNEYGWSLLAQSGEGYDHVNFILSDHDLLTLQLRPIYIVKISNSKEYVSFTLEELNQVQTAFKLNKLKGLQEVVLRGKNDEHSFYDALSLLKQASSLITVLDNSTMSKIKPYVILNQMILELCSNTLETNYIKANAVVASFLNRARQFLMQLQIFFH